MGRAAGVDLSVVRWMAVNRLSCQAPIAVAWAEGVCWP